MHLANETLESTTLKSGWNLEAFVIIVTHPNASLRPAKQILSAGRFVAAQRREQNKEPTDQRTVFCQDCLQIEMQNLAPS
jgi:hypothetical protein